MCAADPDRNTDVGACRSQEHESPLGSRSDVVVAISRFQKLQGPRRLDPLETMLPEVLKASLFRYRWMEVVSADPPPLVSGSEDRALPKSRARFLVDGSFIESGGQVTLSVQVKNGADNNLEYQVSEVFGESEINEAIERLGRRLGQELERKIKPSERRRSVPFGIADSFQVRNRSTGDSLAKILPSLLFNALSRSNSNNVSFKRLEPNETVKSAKVDAVVSGDYVISGNELRVAAVIAAKSGLTLRMETAGRADEALRVSRALAARLLEIIPAIITPDGSWREEVSALTGAPAEQYLARGEGYYRARNPSLAILMFRKAIELNKDYVEPQLRLAEIYMDEADYEAAIVEYQQVVSSAPSRSAARYGLGLAYSRKGEYGDAIREFQEALRLVDDAKTKATWQKSLGDAYLGSESYENAVRWYRSAESIAADPELSVSLARAYLMGNRSDEQVRTLETALKRFPKSAEIRNELAAAYNRNGRQYYGDAWENRRPYEDVLKEFEKSIALNIDDPAIKAEAYAYKGAIVGSLLDKKDLPGGIALVEESVKLDASGEWNHRVLGVLYAEAKRSEEAIKMFKRAIELEPTAIAYHALAGVYRAMKEHRLALENAQQALKIEPDHTAALEEVAIAHLNLQEYDRAVEALNKYLGLQPKSPWAFTELARAHYWKKDYERAMTALQEALKLDPEYFSAYDLMAEIHIKKEEYGEALQVLQRALPLNPKSVSTRANLAFLYFRQDELEKAWEHLEVAIGISPTAWGYTMQGKIHAKRSEYPKAIASLDAALGLDAKYQDAYQEMKRVYKDTSKSREFIERLKAVVKLYPDYAWAFKELGDEQRVNGDRDAAIEAYLKVVQLEPDKLGRLVREHLARLYLEKRSFAAALEHARNWVESDGSKEGPHLLLSTIYIQQQEHTKAIEMLRQATASFPGSAALVTQLADAYRLSRQYDEARRNCQKALELSPGYPRAYSIMARIQVAERQFEEAAANARKAIEGGVLEYSALRDAYHGRRQISEGVHALREYLEKQPNNPILVDLLVLDYHEHLLDYGEAYRLLEKAYDLDPKNPSTRQNFAESNLTTGRFQQAVYLANGVLNDPTISPESKLIMNLINIAALLFSGKQANAFAELGDFFRRYRAIPEDYPRSWMYNGTKSFVTKSGLGTAEKELILALIDVLEAPKAEAAERVTQLEASLADRLKQFQKVATRQ